MKSQSGSIGPSFAFTALASGRSHCIDRRWHESIEYCRTFWYTAADTISSCAPSSPLFATSRPLSDLGKCYLRKYFCFTVAGKSSGLSFHNHLPRTRTNIEIRPINLVLNGGGHAGFQDMRISEKVDIFDVHSSLRCSKNCRWSVK